LFPDGERRHFSVSNHYRPERDVAYKRLLSLRHCIAPDLEAELKLLFAALALVAAGLWIARSG
jgi:hypothetical protein